MELKVPTFWLLSIGTLAVYTLAQENQVLPFKSNPECVDEKVGQENEMHYNRLVKRDYEERAAGRMRRRWQRQQRLRQIQLTRREQVQQNWREQMDWSPQINGDILFRALQRDDLHYIIDRITLRRDILRVLMRRLDNSPQVMEDRRREEGEAEEQQSQEETDRSEQTGRSSPQNNQ